MINAQKYEINAKKIGYMSYNKLNVFMSTLLVGFSITFAILGDRVNISNTFTSMGVWPWRNIGIIFGITLASIFGIAFTGRTIFKLGPMFKDKIINNPIIIAAIISIFSVIGILCLMFQWQWALVFIAILLVIFTFFNIVLWLKHGMSNVSLPSMTGLIHVFGLVYDSIIHKINRIPESRPESRIGKTLLLIFLLAGSLITIIILVAAILDLPPPFS